MRVMLFLTATIVSLGLFTEPAGACPKCRLGAAALTGVQVFPSDLTCPHEHEEGHNHDHDHAHGDDATGTDFDVNADAAPRNPLHPFSLTGGTSVTSAYFHRGYLQEDQGVIAQPYLTLSLLAYQRDDFSVTPYVSWWNSLHDEHTFNDGDYDLWYESEIMAGAVFAKGPASVDVKYTLFTYPNGALSEIDEIGVKFSYDLASLWRKPNEPADFVLVGWVAFDKELSDQNNPPVPSDAMSGASVNGTPDTRTISSAAPPRAAQLKSAGGDVSVNHAPIFHQPQPPAGGSGAEEGFDTSTQGAYFELGLEPSFRTKLGKTPLGLSFPITLGLGAADYYQESGGHNDPLGYVQAGVVATVPLPMPGEGKWYLSASVYYLHLFADSLRFANYGDDDEIIAGIGIGFSY